MKIFIDAGHGGSDSGAVGNGFYEKNITLDISLKQKALFLKLGHQVMLSRETDKTVSLVERTNMANSWGADIFISNHINAGGGVGMEVWCSILGGEGKNVANRIVANIGDMFTNRGVKTKKGSNGEDYYHVIRETKMSAILNEFGFIDNVGDANKLKDENFRQRCAELVVKSVLNIATLPSQEPTTLDYEKELCRIIVDGKNVIALTGLTKCVAYAKENHVGSVIKIQCVKDNKFLTEFTVPKPQPPQPQEPPKQEVVKNPIVGQAKVSAEQLVTALMSKNKQPKLDGMNPLEFCKLFVEEGNVEGIRGDIAFCQAIKETGWFNFGGDVVQEQHNYAGIGTVGGGVKGHFFKDQREGVRGQIQHLKAYATKDALVNACVDPRYSLVTKGIAPNWEDLNGRWAVPGNGYGEDILRIYGEISNTVVDENLIKELTKPVVVEPPKEEKPPVVEQPKEDLPQEKVDSIVAKVINAIVTFIVNWLTKKE